MDGTSNRQCTQFCFDQLGHKRDLAEARSVNLHVHFTPAQCTLALEPVTDPPTNALPQHVPQNRVPLDSLSLSSGSMTRVATGECSSFAVACARHGLCTPSDSKCTPTYQQCVESVPTRMGVVGSGSPMYAQYMFTTVTAQCSRLSMCLSAIAHPTMHNLHQERKGSCVSTCDSMSLSVGCGRPLRGPTKVATVPATRHTKIDTSAPIEIGMAMKDDSEDSREEGDQRLMDIALQAVYKGAKATVVRERTDTGTHRGTQVARWQGCKSWRNEFHGSKALARQEVKDNSKVAGATGTCWMSGPATHIAAFKNLYVIDEDESETVEENT